MIGPADVRNPLIAVALSAASAGRGSPARQGVVIAPTASGASPATLPPGSPVSLTAMLVTASGTLASLDVTVEPALTGTPLPAATLTAFLRGEPVTGVLGKVAELALDDATVRLPLQPRELPPTAVSIRLLAPRSPTASDAAQRSDLPRLRHDATLGARLEPLVGAVVPIATAELIPLALLGPPGAAAVISLALEPDDHPSSSPAGDEPKVLALEVDYPRLGRVRLVMRTASGRTDLIVRSEKRLTPAVRGEIGQLLEAAGAAAGMRPSTGFATLSGGES